MDYRSFLAGLTLFCFAESTLLIGQAASVLLLRRLPHFEFVLSPEIARQQAAIDEIQRNNHQQLQEIIAMAKGVNLQLEELNREINERAQRKNEPR